MVDLYARGHRGQFIGNRYGAGSGQIWLDNVRCLGMERKFAECRHSGWGSSNCTHDNDVSVSCITGKYIIIIIIIILFESGNMADKHKQETYRHRDKGGKVTSAGWQVTLCDLIWHVISRSGVVISITNCYIRFTYLLILTDRQIE